MDGWSGTPAARAAVFPRRSAWRLNVFGNRKEGMMWTAINALPWALLALLAGLEIYYGVVIALL